MPLITWNQNLSVKVAEVDRQHQKLIQMLNDLAAAMQQGKGKDIIGKIVSGLNSYTKIHFQMEEKHFDQFGYPDREDHKKAHSFFIQKVTSFERDVASGKLGTPIEVLNFLSDWLRNHIMKTDMAYSGFFNSHGLV